jgi:outer membrane translocation and assembly module TamA
MAAVDIYADLRSSHTPWLLWAKVGGENRMRGYYYGRYIDRNMITAQVELRQQIYGPISGVVWGGAGSLFTSFNQIEIKEVLPNYGVGVRFAAGGGMSLRVDYGFGRHSNGLVIHVNEAF